MAEVFLAVFLIRHPNGESVRQIDFSPTVPGSFRPMFELLHFYKQPSLVFLGINDKDDTLCPGEISLPRG